VGTELDTRGELHNNNNNNNFNLDAADLTWLLKKERIGDVDDMP